MKVCTCFLRSLSYSNLNQFEALIYNSSVRWYAILIQMLRSRKFFSLSFPFLVFPHPFLLLLSLSRSVVCVYMCHCHLFVANIDNSLEEKNRHSFYQNVKSYFHNLSRHSGWLFMLNYSDSFIFVYSSWYS